MKISIYKFRLFIGSMACCASIVAKADGIPTGYPADRYKALWEHSPFTIASAQQETTRPGFAEKLVLIGIASIGDKNMVTLYNKDSQERITVGIGENPQGLKLVSVDADADPLKASVTIQKGSEIARVRFDKTQLTSAQVSPPVANNSTAPVSATTEGQNPAAAGGPPVAVRRSVRIPPIPNPVPLAAGTSNSNQQPTR